MSTELKTYDLVVTRVFDAPIDLVWKAWSDPKHVMQWWGPTGFTSPSCEMDFREGGRALVCMRAPAEYGGQDMYNTWNYQKIVPMQRIEYILNFADQNGNTLDPSQVGVPPGVPRDVRHLVTLKPEGEKKTELSVTEFGYLSEEAVVLSKAGLEECLDKMAASFVRD